MTEYESRARAAQLYETVYGQQRIGISEMELVEQLTAELIELVDKLYATTCAGRTPTDLRGYLNVKSKSV